MTPGPGVDNFLCEVVPINVLHSSESPIQVKIQWFISTNIGKQFNPVLNLKKITICVIRFKYLKPNIWGSVLSWARL